MLSPAQLKTEFLPLLSVIFVSENSLVAAVRTTHCAQFISMLGHKEELFIVNVCVCVIRATTAAPCCSVAMTVGH